MSAQRRTATKRNSAIGPSPRASKAPKPSRAAGESGGRPSRPASERPKAQAQQQAQPRFVAQRTEGLRRFSRETLAEVKKVNWPDQQTTRNLTLVVIGLSVVLGIVLGGIDFFLYRLFEAIP